MVYKQIYKEINLSQIMDLINEFSLSALFYKNSIKTQKKILFELKQLPLHVGDGYIYCFRLINFANTQTNFKFKIGRTGRTAEQRIGEQKGIQMFSLCTIFYFKLERLCHLFFRFANVRGEGDGREMFLFTKNYGVKVGYFIKKTFF